jgi:biopolymer transport protein TolQ
MAPHLGKGLQGIVPALAGLGTVVQLIVLLALLLASVICWGIVVQKARLLRKVRRDNANFLLVFHSGNDLAFLAAAARRFAFSPLARLFRVIHQQIESVPGNGRRLAKEGGLPTATMMTPEHLRHTLRLRQAEEIAHLEQGLSFLATTTSIAPFVGLFGTVWGIMQSFHEIGRGGSASLAVVGPGISEALVATAAGLAAAIPAAVAYNYYLNRIKRLEEELDGFAEELVYMCETQLSSPAHRVGNRSPLQRS